MVERENCDVCGTALEHGRCPTCGEGTPLERLPREFGENPVVTGLIAAAITAVLVLLGRVWIASL